jgi:hypothetical protein
MRARRSLVAAVFFGFGVASCNTILGIPSPFLEVPDSASADGAPGDGAPGDGANKDASGMGDVDAQQDAVVEVGAEGGDDAANDAPTLSSVYYTASLPVTTLAADENHLFVVLNDGSFETIAFADKLVLPFAGPLVSHWSSGIDPWLVGDSVDFFYADSAGTNISVWSKLGGPESRTGILPSGILLLASSAPGFVAVTGGGPTSLFFTGRNGPVGTEVYSFDYLGMPLPADLGTACHSADSVVARDANGLLVLYNNDVSGNFVSRFGPGPTGCVDIGTTKTALARDFVLVGSTLFFIDQSFSLGAQISALPESGSSVVGPTDVTSIESNPAGLATRNGLLYWSTVDAIRACTASFMSCAGDVRTIATTSTQVRFVLTADAIYWADGMNVMRIAL